MCPYSPQYVSATPSDASAIQSITWGHTHRITKTIPWLQNMMTHHHISIQRSVFIITVVTAGTNTSITTILTAGTNIEVSLLYWLLVPTQKYQHYTDCWYQHRSISTILTAGTNTEVSLLYWLLVPTQKYQHYTDCWYQHRSISTILTAGMVQEVNYKFHQLDLHSSLTQVSDKYAQMHINFQYRMGHTAFSSSNLTLTNGLELSLQQTTIKLTSILFGSHPVTFGLLTYICTKPLAQSNHIITESKQKRMYTTVYM